MSKLTLRNAILSYPHLDQAWAGTEGQEPKFRASFLIPLSDTATLDALKAAVVEAYLEGVEKKGLPKLKKDTEATYENVMKVLGNKATLYDGEVNLHGTYHLGEPEPAGLVNYAEVRTSASAKFPPMLYKPNRERLPQEDGAMAFAGEVVHAVVNAYPYNAGGSRGVAFGLQGIILTQQEGALGRLAGVDVAGEFASAGLFSDDDPFADSAEETATSEFAL